MSDRYQPYDYRRNLNTLDEREKEKEMKHRDLYRQPLYDSTGARPRVWLALLLIGLALTAVVALARILGL